MPLPRSGLVAATREAEWNVAAAALTKGAAVRVIMGTLLDHWGSPTLRKADNDGGTGPGMHGIPEIGRAEEAFYSALTTGQKEAYKALEQLVTMLYERGMSWEGIDPWQLDEPLERWKMRAIAALAAQPMQAYLLGQMFATEAAQATVHRPLMPDDRRAIQTLEHYTFNEIDSSFDDLKGELRNQLIGGISTGLGPKEVARAMASILDDHKTNWEMIAITETARAESQGRLQELLDQGYTHVIGSSAHDPRVCDWCRDNINDKVVKIADIIGKSNYGRKADARLPVIPGHPRCVVAGQRVSTARGLVPIEDVRVGDMVLTHRGRFRAVVATASRFFSGTIHDVGGLRVTGEHPILTVNGFRTAALLGERVDVLGIDRKSAQHVRLSRDSHDAPAERSENRFFRRILSAFLRRSVPAATVDLDRKHRVGQSQIDIKLVDGELGFGALAEHSEFVEHASFVGAHLRRELDSARSRALRFMGLPGAANGIVSRARLTLTRSLVHARPFQFLGGGSTARYQTETGEMTVYARSGATDPLRDNVYGFAALVRAEKITNFFVRNRRPAILPRSVHVAPTQYEGIVYDLQVREDETFVVEGVAVHNCRCLWLPYDED